MIPSSRHSADTEVSRCAIAAWASRTWAFDSANVLPPLRPRARAAVSPARVRSRDQQQHVEELDILRARIDDIAQLVTDSAAQHEQHAATLTQHATALQAQLQQLDTQVGILTEQYAHITKDYKTLAASLAQT